MPWRCALLSLKKMMLQYTTKLVLQCTCIRIPTVHDSDYEAYVPTYHSSKLTLAKSEYKSQIAC
jgi:hypothetical protein